MNKHLKTMLLLCGIIGTTHGSNLTISDENSESHSSVLEKQKHADRSALSETETNLSQTLGLASDDSAQIRHNNSQSLLIAMVDDQIAALNNRIDTLSQEIKHLNGFVNLADIFDPRALSHLKSYNRAMNNRHFTIIERSYFSSKIKLLKRGLVSQEEQIAIEKKLLKKPTRVTKTGSGRDQTRTETSLLKEAQQNCLGKITDIQYDAMSGAKQTVFMAPSTTRLAKQTAPRGPIVMNGLTWQEIVAEVERIHGSRSTDQQ